MKRFAIAALVLGCGSSGDGETAADVTSSGASSEATSAGTTAPPPTTSTSGSTSTTNDASTGSATTGGSSSETAAPEQACGLEDLKPGAPDPIVAGTAAMQIPPDIASILVSSCGCHLADDLDVMTPDYPDTGPFEMPTWEGWQALSPVANTPYYEIALGYLDSEFMPLASTCNVDGEAMDPTDRATLVTWVTDGAPDGATWVP